MHAARPRPSGRGGRIPDVTYAPIPKPPLASFKVRPNLGDYEKMRRSFTWDDAAKGIEGLPGGGLNIAHECIDRHLKTARRSKPALLWEDKDGRRERYTFEEFKEHVDRTSQVLLSLGVQKGDRVFIFLDRIPELYFSVFAGLQAGAVVGPLFSAFGPDAIRDRLQDSAAKVLVTSPSLLPRLTSIRRELPDLSKILLVNRDGHDVPTLSHDVISYEAETMRAKGGFVPVPTGPEDFAIMHYTSGTTGKPKGAAHVHQAIHGHWATAKYVLDLHDDDIYWCTADPGWVTGTSYGMFGPWSNGITSVVYHGGFGPEK